MADELKVIADGVLALTSAEQSELRNMLKHGDRGGFYMAYYAMTGSNQALQQAKISTFSGPTGGAAFGANRLLQERFPDTYKGVYYLSQRIALDAFAAIVEDVEQNRSGNVSDDVIFNTAADT